MPNTHKIAVRAAGIVLLVVAVAGAFALWRRTAIAESQRKGGVVATYYRNVCADSGNQPQVPVTGREVRIDGHLVKCVLTMSPFVWSPAWEGGVAGCDMYGVGLADRFFACSEEATLDGYRCFVFRDGGVVLHDSEVDWSTHLRK